MKKFLLFFAIIISIPMMGISQEVSVIEPRQWTGWKSVRNGLPTVADYIERQYETTAFIFESPISIDSDGEMNSLHVFQHPLVHIYYMTSDGDILDMDVPVYAGPREQSVWVKKFVTTPFAIEVVGNDGSRNFFYNEPRRATLRCRVRLNSLGQAETTYQLMVAN